MRQRRLPPARKNFLLRDKSSSRCIEIVISCCKIIPPSIGRYSLGPILSRNSPPAGRFLLVQEDCFLSALLLLYNVLSAQLGVIPDTLSIISFGFLILQLIIH